MLRRLAPLVALLPLTLSACGEEDPPEWGTVPVELVKSTAVEGDPFAGTDRMIITLYYVAREGQNDYEDFYNERNPEYASDGVEGGAVFEEWMAKLCDPGSFDGVPDCEVLTYQQNLASIAGTAGANLSITYKINDPSTLEFSKIRFGPLPTTDKCDCGGLIRAELGSAYGLSESGQTLWVIDKFGESREAVVNQGGALRLFIRNDD